MHPPRIRAAPRGLQPLVASIIDSSGLYGFSRTRTFKHYARRRILTPNHHRPQLQFLSPPSGQTWSRLLTTERKRLLKDTFRLAGKYTVYGWSIFGLFSIVSFGIGNEILERQFPTPPMWTIVTKFDYRQARKLENPNSNDHGVVDWAAVGGFYRAVLDRLESASYDGQGLEEQDEGGILIAGIGKAGLDISDKPEPWRRGYHSTLMGLAKAAENLDGWMRDRTRRYAFPADKVVGPSNPNPRPSPPGVTPPREEDCERAFESPEYYYTKLLTTHGFTTAQRLEGATAYGDWLHSKGLPEAAEEMYRWGLDIALAPYLDTNSIVDTKSGVLSLNGPSPSESLLLATTSLAIHYARCGDLSSSLPILLSVLRARRQLPTIPKPAELTELEKALAAPVDQEDSSSSFFQSTLDSFTSLFHSNPYPAAPLSGDEPPFRVAGELCEEAGLMVYIGEVLFASGAESRHPGLAWTREAVDVSEAQLVGAQQSLVEEEKQKCRQCLETGLENWAKMVAKLGDEEKRNSSPEKPNRTSTFWGSGESAPVQRGRWEAEEKVVGDRLRRAERVLEKMDMDAEMDLIPFPFNLLNFSKS